MYVHGLAIFCASMNLNAVLSKIVREVWGDVCARVQVDFAQGSVGENRICCRAFVLLVVTDKMFDRRRDTIGLQTVHICRGKDT